MEKRGINTRMIHGGDSYRSSAREVNVPVYLCSTFEKESFDSHSPYAYARVNNPTREAFEKLVADLEGAAAAYGFASGMAASSAAISLLNSGDKVVVGGNFYGGTYDVLKKQFTRFGIRFEMAPIDDLDEFDKALTPDVNAIFLETPSNPTLHVTDLRRVSELAHKKNLLVIVDNTFSSPYIQRPLEFGVDVVVESATKYLGGHSDIIAGIVAVRDPALAERVHGIQKMMGGILQPFDAYLLLRSVKTLGVRLDRQCSNALKIAEFLSGQEGVSRVYYPGLKTDPGYEIQMKQARNGGAMLSFDLAEGYDPAAFLNSLKIFANAASLGGVEALIGHPATSSHDNFDEKTRLANGISNQMIRVSPGLEDAEDLIADLAQALEKAKK